MPIWCTLTPVQLDELFGDQSYREVEFTHIFAYKLYREIGDRNEECMFVGGNELTLRQQAFDPAEKRHLFGRRWGSQSIIRMECRRGWKQTCSGNSPCP